MDFTNTLLVDINVAYGSLDQLDELYSVAFPFIEECKKYQRICVYPAVALFEFMSIKRRKVLNENNNLNFRIGGEVNFCMLYLDDTFIQRYLYAEPPKHLKALDSIYYSIAKVENIPFITEDTDFNKDLIKSNIRVYNCCEARTALSIGII